MKAHPALFEGRRRGEPKNEALLFQSTVIHFQNAHKIQKKTAKALTNEHQIPLTLLYAFIFK